MYDNGYGTDPYAYQPQPQPRPSRASSFLRTVLSVLVLVVLVVLLSWGLRTFVFQASAKAVSATFLTSIGNKVELPAGGGPAAASR